MIVDVTIVSLAFVVAFVASTSSDMAPRASHVRRSSICKQFRQHLCPSLIIVSLGTVRHFLGNSRICKFYQGCEVFFKEIRGLKKEMKGLSIRVVRRLAR